MKKFIIGLVLGISVSVIAADVVLEITVPDRYVQDVADAFVALQGCHMSIEARGHGDPENEYDARTDYTFPTQLEGESLKDFAKRCIVKHSNALVIMNKRHDKDLATREAITTALASVPDVNEAEVVIE